jgi:hypothetical protein
MAVCVQVRFCGGCNPEMDRGGVVRQIMAVFGKKVQWTFDAQPKQKVDLILHVNGCAHACLDEQAERAGSVPVVSVQGLHLERKPVAEQDLARCTALKLMRMAAQCRPGSG